MFWYTHFSLQILEDDVIESHSQLLLSMEKWVEQDNTLLGMTNEVDYDQDGINAYFNYNIYLLLWFQHIHSC